MATYPDITFRITTAPYSTASDLVYKQLTPGGSDLPVLINNDSEFLYFRIYNNYALNSGLADATNVRVTTYDGYGLGSHTALQAVASGLWLHILQNGYGENSLTPGLFSMFAGSDLAVGGTNTYVFQKGSNGAVGNSQIRAGSNHMGCGFIELKTYMRIPDNAVEGEHTFAVNVTYDWVS